jgi:uncharacterized membrane protein HdeD (DUF308 family)
MRKPTSFEVFTILSGAFCMLPAILLLFGVLHAGKPKQVAVTLVFFLGTVRFLRGIAEWVFLP